MHNGLLKKTAITFTVLLTVVVAVVALMSYWVINKQLRHQLVDTHLELLRQVDDKLELMLKSIDKSTIKLLRSKEAIHFFEAERQEGSYQEIAYRANSMLEDLVNSDDYISSIDMFSFVRQRFLSGAVTVNDTESYADKQWIYPFESYEGFSDWLPTRRVPIDEVRFGSYHNVVTLVRTYPLLHSPGSRRGAVAVNIKEDRLYALIDDLGPSSMNTFIVDREGHVILDRDKSRLGRDVSETPYIRRILQSGAPEGHFGHAVNEVASAVFFAEVAYADWYIVRVVPDMQLNQPVIAIRNGLFVLVPILLVIAALLTIVISRWSLRPVQGFLHSISRHVTAHHPQSGSAVPSYEFGYLERAVENMVSSSEQLHQQMNESKPILRWQLLTELLSNYRRSFTNVRAYMDMLGIKLYEHQLVAMAIEFDNKAEFDQPSDLRLYAYALCNVAEELINAENLGVAVELEDGACAVIMSFRDPVEAEQQLMRAVSVGDLIKNYVSDNFKRTISIGIGLPVDDIQDIHLSYGQAIEALSYKMIMGQDAIIAYDDLPPQGITAYHRLFAATDQITGALRTGDAASMKALIAKWFDAIAAQNVPPPIIRHLVVQALMKAANELDDLGVDREGLLARHNPYEMLDRYERLDELEGLIGRILLDALERIRAKRGRRERNAVIDQVLEYIHDNYMRSDLSLNLLADQFGLSVSYISKQFKEQQECNFIDYLMEYRMEKARHLLQSSDAKIREVSERLGYTNVNSFVRIFKKSTGMTPTEFREKQTTVRQDDIPS
ncbi:AraC family transcriptional regulator [Paenibacillus sp. 598K]|uniref:helix-turn-helix domain-containing protein n=1 Tax=Paenibacillus sp. 598K TaxID=1117987 RepID=UPI000FFA9452|nr:helix-turn-helix domain-containing protein [Paenibacillus sp. 598K]GBF73435.1 AraC family transcriptional regulator [Paenibacillus sp. 598K]